MGTDVATQSSGGAVAAYDYGQFAGAGFEGTTAADFKPSFLRVLQGNSPQVESVEAAKPGLIIDSITNDVYPSVVVVPAVREHVYVAWKPRSAEGGSSGGSGFGGVYQINDPKVQEALKKVGRFQRGADGKMILPEIDNGEFQLVETVYFHCVQLLDNGAMVPVTLAFFSTGLPVASTWLTMMNRQVIPGTIQPKPLFAHAFKLGSVKSQRGTMSWYNFAPTWANNNAQGSALAPDSALFQAGASIYTAFKQGRVDVDYSASGNQGGGNEGSATDSRGDVADKEVPF